MNLKENEPFLWRPLTIKHSLGSGLIEDSEVLEGGYFPAGRPQHFCLSPGCGV